MIVPVFSSSDQTHLPNYLGDKKEWPAYMSVRNMDLSITSTLSNLARILVVLLPVPPKYRFNGHAETTAVKEKQIQDREGVRKVFEFTFRRLNGLFNSGKLGL